uniref:Uncharacterized protein n=1 Tax=Takifugu rubripes TaxID=31033 RepID=A0A674P7H2_TAKRU
FGTIVKLALVILRCLEVILGCSRVILGCLEVILGCSRVILGCSRVILGCSQVILGCSRVILGCSQVILGCSQVILGCSQVILGCSRVISSCEGVFMSHRSGPSKATFSGLCITSVPLAAQQICHHAQVASSSTSYCPSVTFQICPLSLILASQVSFFQPSQSWRPEEAPPEGPGQPTGS